MAEIIGQGLEVFDQLVKIPGQQIKVFGKRVGI